MLFVDNDACSFGGTLREFLVLEYASSLVSHHRPVPMLTVILYLYLFYLFLRGGLRPALRPSISCGPMCSPDITKG